MVKYFALLVVLPLLAGCLPEGGKIPKTKEDIKIISGYLGKEQFFIPKEYFKQGIANFNGGTISLQMIQPEFLPIQKSHSQMLQDGEHTKLIRVLANEQRSFRDFSDNISDQIDHLKAYEQVGIEYGLVHLKQPKEEVQDFWDMWIEREGKRNISYIYCNDDNSVPFPQCTHSMREQGVYIQVHYDKRNLPDWKKIQAGVVNTMRSFKGADTAREILFNKYQDYHLNNKTGSK